MKVERHGDTCRMTIVIDPIFTDFAFSNLVKANVVDSDATIVLDVHFIGMLHSPGLANLVALYVHLRRRGKQLVLTGVNTHNRRLLAMTHLDQLLAIT